MTNLWGVLLQTCSVSLVAGLLLGLKRVWKQTLSHAGSLLCGEFWRSEFYFRLL